MLVDVGILMVRQIPDMNFDEHMCNLSMEEAG